MFPLEFLAPSFLDIFYYLPIAIKCYLFKHSKNKNSRLQTFKYPRAQATELKFNSINFVQPWIPGVEYTRPMINRSQKRPCFDWVKYLSILAKRQARKYILGPDILRLLCAINSRCSLHPPLCFLASFSVLIWCILMAWVPHWPLERMPVVRVSPIDENVLALAAVFSQAGVSERRAAEVTDNVIYPHFTWKQYHFFESL